MTSSPWPASHQATTWLRWAAPRARRPARWPGAEYIELLSTFSGHLIMADWQRERLFGEIRRRLALREDGSVRRHWGAVLSVARRIERGSA